MTRLPPKLVSTSTIPGGSPRTSPMSAACSQPGTAPDPAETPREDLDALALADLVDRAQVTADVGKLDTAWALLNLRGIDWTALGSRTQHL